MYMCNLCYRLTEYQCLNEGSTVCKECLEDFRGDDD